jgi:hypothetical protein
MAKATKQKLEPLNPGHYNEILHVAYMFGDIVYDHLVEHLYMEHHPEIKKKAERVVSDLYDIYQEISKSFPDE